MLTPAELERLAGDYKERHERDLMCQHRMSEFAATRSCRWADLYDYFGREDDSDRPTENCGHCDNCSG